MGTFLPFAPPCRGNVPPSFALLSTEEPVSTAAMNDGGGEDPRFFRFAVLTDLSNRVGVSVCIWSQECTARSFSMSGLGLCARA